jgi:hypothetical protein
MPSKPLDIGPLPSAGGLLSRQRSWLPSRPCAKSQIWLIPICQHSSASWWTLRNPHWCSVATMTPWLGWMAAPGFLFPQVSHCPTEVQCSGIFMAAYAIFLTCWRTKSLSYLLLINLTFALARSTEPWTARQQRYLSYIAKSSSIMRHMAGQDKCMADLLSHPWGHSQQLRAVERKPTKVKVPSGSFVAVASTTGVSHWLSVCDEVCQSWSGCQLSGTAARETTKIKVPSRSL